MDLSPDPDPPGDTAVAPLVAPAAIDRLARAWLRADVCWFLGCSEGTLDRLIAESDFPTGTRLGTTTLRRWRPADVAAWIDAQFTPATVAPPQSAPASADHAAPRSVHVRPPGMALPHRR